MSRALNQPDKVAPKTLEKVREAISLTGYVPKLLDGGFIDGAVFCSSDTLAQGALAELQSRGLAIPGQIALVGFGDQAYAAHTFPPLTTIKFDRAQIGQKATEALLARFNSRAFEPKVIDVGFQLIERQTT